MSMDYQLLQYKTEQEQLQSKWYSKVDLFAFLPVPKTKPQSSKSSIIGSIIFIIVILTYLISGFVMFLTHNIPKIVQLNGPLDFTKFLDFQQYDNGKKQQYIAFAFQNGFDLNENFFDPSFFTITLNQIHQPKVGKKVYDNVTAVNCTKEQQAWTKVDDLVLQCPSGDLRMRGVLGQSDDYDYFRIVIQGCKNNTADPKAVVCQTPEKIKQQLGYGRFFLYLYKPESINYNTKEIIPSSIIIKQYFLVYGFYNRVEMIIQEQDIVETPNYFTSFSNKNSTKLTLKNENFFVSQVNDTQLFTIWFRMDEQVQDITVKYNSIIDMISVWGAFCSVVFTAFVFFFLRYNSDRFYKTNPNWEKFDQELEKLRNINDRQKSTISMQEHEIEDLRNSIHSKQNDV